MDNRDELRDAFTFADDVLELEGFELTADMRAIQRKVINGELTFDDAVATCLKQFGASDEQGGDGQ